MGKLIGFVEVVIFGGSRFIGKGCSAAPRLKVGVERHWAVTSRRRVRDATNSTLYASTQYPPEAKAYTCHSTWLSVEKAQFLLCS